jgi:exodeoxyribonuclease VII large subunit
MIPATNAQMVYTPASLITVFAKLLRYAPEERTLLQIRGVYRRAGVKSYGGVFYDQLQEEQTDHVVTLKMPERLRVDVQNGNVYVLEGALERSLRKDGTIALLFVVSAIQGQEQRAYTSEQEALFSLLQQRMTRGVVDVAALFKGILYKADRPKIALVYGEQGIVHKDVESALGEGQKSYDFVEFRINMTTPQELLEVMEEISEGRYDAYAVIRGGGSGLEMFSEMTLLEKALEVTVPLLTAIGHAEDHPYLEQFADKVFVTPTALGGFLRGISDDVVLERESSRVHLLEELQKQFSGERARERELWEKERGVERAEQQQRVELLERQIIGLRRVVLVGGVFVVILLVVLLFML